MQISPELHEDLTRWLADAESEDPSGDVTDSGLCSYVRASVRDELDEIFHQLYFKGKCSCPVFPFGGCKVYFTEFDENRCHLNPQRIAFVKGVLNVT